ncbi:HutD/Ves family protein [Oleomonas cavernae]|nr:HutD family protein [Oleomonas cavernae]
MIRDDGFWAMEVKAVIILRRAESHTVMSWANGGGRTAEIVVYPPQASVAARDFLWRISMADVATDGPFSALPGFDRNLTLIAGKGMTLDAGEHGTMTVAQPFEQAVFPGDWKIDARLHDGPIEDLNVMTRRGAASASVDIILVTGRHYLRQRDAAMVVVVLDGRVSADARHEGGENFDLIRRDALLIAPGVCGDLTLEGAPQGTVAIITLRDLGAEKPAMS